MIIGDNIYSVQNYLSIITNQYYTVDADIDDDVEFIANILNTNGYKGIRSYDYHDVASIAQPDIACALVSVMKYDNAQHRYIESLRWYEIPKAYVNKI